MSLELHTIEPIYIPPSPGNLLISEPFLSDYHFRRTAVLISNHNEEGSIGFVLNRLIDLTTQDVIPGLLKHNFPLFFGGPVEPNTLHFIHKLGTLIKGAQQISSGVYWGGDIEMVDDLINRNIAQPNEFKFFSGYSGWAEGQLQEEISNKSWWVTKPDEDVVFDDDLENMWRNIVKGMGKNFSYMANAPEDRTWN
jgi:putative transcriptional regulator